MHHALFLHPKVWQPKPMLRTSSSSCCRIALGYTRMPSMLNASANDHWAMQGEAAMTCKELTPDRTMTLDVGCRITRMLFIQFISFSFAYFAYSLFNSCPFEKNWGAVLSRCSCTIPCDHWKSSGHIWTTITVSNMQIWSISQMKLLRAAKHHCILGKATSALVAILKSSTAIDSKSREEPVLSKKDYLSIVKEDTESSRCVQCTGVLNP